MNEELNYNSISNEISIIISLCKLQIDSTTSLLPLIQAYVGILLKVSRITIGSATKFGVTIRSLNEYNKYHNGDDTTENENGDVGIIWTASDWDKIGSFFNHSDERLP